jgi:hypothetical protein
VSRFLTAVIASGFAFGLNAAVAQSLELHPQGTSGEHRAAKESCKTPGEAAGNQCPKAAKAAEENPRMRCEKLKDQAQRECILAAFVSQHDRMSNGGQIETTADAPSGRPQPR